MAANLKKITSYFDSCRKAGVEVDGNLLEKAFASHDISSFGHKVPHDSLKNILKEIAPGVTFDLSENQLDEIIKALSNNSLGSTVDLKTWKACFKYWMRRDVSEKSALIVIDVQNDFISGSLALRNCPAKQEGEEVVAVINKLKHDVSFDLVVFSLDWHPVDHCSFASNVKKYPIHESSKVKADDAKVFDVVVYDGEPPMEQVLWPDHCVQGSDGAKLHADLKVSSSDILVYKGKIPSVDSYSAFWDNGKKSQTELFSVLMHHNITRVFVCGLAIDFCVAYSAVDAAELGFETYMIEDASRGVSHDSITKEKKRMVEAGVSIIDVAQVAVKVGK